MFKISYFTGKNPSNVFWAELHSKTLGCYGLIIRGALFYLPYTIGYGITEESQTLTVAPSGGSSPNLQFSPYSSAVSSGCRR